MATDNLIESLDDQDVLLEAYAASSAYVMRKVFEASEKLQAFKDRDDLAPKLVVRIEQLANKPSDPVILGVHLYALDATGAKPKIYTAILRVLEQEAFRDDPLVGQLAGEMGINLVKTRKEAIPGAALISQQMSRRP